MLLLLLINLRPLMTEPCVVNVPLASDDNLHGLEQNACVHPQRPVFHVAAVEFDPFGISGVVRPLTCHRPVIRAHTQIVPTNLAVTSELTTVIGRGPTRLISPRNTFNSCGNSSRLVLRKKLPMGVMRGSSRNFWSRFHSARASGWREEVASICSESRYMDRNFRQRKSLPFGQPGNGQKNTVPIAAPDEKRDGEHHWRQHRDDDQGAQLIGTNQIDRAVCEPARVWRDANRT